MSDPHPLYRLKAENEPFGQSLIGFTTSVRRSSATFSWRSCEATFADWKRIADRQESMPR